jgi:hypothetical protein
VPTENYREDMPLHRQLGMHTGCEGGHENLTLRRRIVAAQDVR